MTTPASAPADPDPAPGARVTPTFGRGVLAAILYIAVFMVAGLLSGVGYDDITESRGNVVGFVVIPVGLGILVTLAVTARWGWWRALFHERHRLEGHRWVWLVPALMVATIIGQLIAAPWHEFDTGLVLLIFVGTMLVGFGEEIVFRGYLLLGARARWNEKGAWLVTSLLFGLFHGLNILTGQAVGTTIRQVIFAFVMGGALYLVRRLSGLLVVGMVIHGFWDFSTFLAGGRGDAAADPSAGGALAGFIGMFAMLVTIAALIAVFRRGGGAVSTD